MHISWPLVQWAIALLAFLLFFLSSWIVIPAPTFSLLPLGVGAPEVSPFLLLGNGVILAMGLMVRFWGASHSPLRSITIALSLIGLVLSSLPLLQLPSTVQRAEAQMQTALGPDYSAKISPRLQAKMRPRPFVLMDMVRGLPRSAIEPLQQTISTPDGATLALDIYQPPTKGQHNPVIVTIYGGAWQRGEPTETARFSAYMAAQGYGVIAIDYRHAPEYRFPTQLEDVKTALGWIVDHAADYHLDCDRMALVGWSAGAHLAMLAAYQPDALPVRAVVNYYGPVNLPEGYRNPPVPDPIRTRDVLETFLGGPPEALPELYQQASPITYVRAALPPTLLIYGQRDHIVKPIYGQQLYGALRAHGNQAVLITLPWSEHAFDAIFTGPGSQIALYYTERFLAHFLN